ncbi:MAG TPA: lipopolysaccharide heptosyltransferase II [Methylibium sp.]|uniref:lipopolysaccharide heptosyltransferase II n=1 Tax=Methylibium sp. TaxID=2067992 RepID=UPI002DB9CB33|nr:lipopolysaccharide heptosyltransferase II [Methylibium sp.]HEU4460513.1 lipopolysaccharide heptosyltransferase II [Methylibium sp.]
MKTRSLVVAPQWIGDAVMAEPMLAALAARGEVLTVAALPWVAPVLRAMPQVADIVTMPFEHGRLDLRGRLATARTLRGRFDAAYVLPNTLKSALVPWLARIPRRVGYQGEGRIGLLDERLPNPIGKPPMVGFYGALAGGVAADARPQLRLDGAVVDAALARHGVEARRYWVYAPGAEYGGAKRWPPEHYAELARTMHARDGLPILLLGSAKEAEIGERIAALAPGACRVLAGRTSLDDAMALIAAARGAASNDSGLMHVAAGFGVPQVALFGSTSPQHTPPLNPHARVLWLKTMRGATPLDCQPCFDRECRFGHLLCLKSIEPAIADEALEQSVACANRLPGNRRGSGFAGPPAAPPGWGAASSRNGAGSHHLP